MGRLTEDMRRLREKANCAQQAHNLLIQELNQFKSDLAHNVDHFWNDQQTARLTHTAENHPNRQNYANNLAKDYRETFQQNLSEQATQLRHAIQTAHANMGQRLLAKQTAFLEDLTDCANELHELRPADQQQPQEDFTDMVLCERTIRNDLAQNLQDTLSQMYEDLMAERAEATRILLKRRTPSIHAKSKKSQSAPAIKSPQSKSQPIEK